MTTGSEHATTADDDLGRLRPWQGDLQAALAAPVPEHVADQHLARLRDALDVLHGPGGAAAVVDEG